MLCGCGICQNIKKKTMPLIDNCATVQKLPIPKKASCLKKVTITKLAYGRTSELDLENVPSDADGCVTGLPMLGGELMCEIGVDPKYVNLTWEYSEDTGYYDYTLTVDLRGFDKECRAAICAMQSMCDLFFWFSATDCKERVLGFEPIDGVQTQFFNWTNSGHSGSIGFDADASNLVTFSGSSFCESLFADIGYTSLPL